MISKTQEFYNNGDASVTINDIKQNQYKQNLKGDTELIQKPQAIELIKDAHRQFDNYLKYEKILQIDNNEDFIITLDETFEPHNADFLAHDLNASVDNEMEISSSNIYLDIHSIKNNNGQLNTSNLSENNLNYQFIYNDMFTNDDYYNNSDIKILQQNVGNYPIEDTPDNILNMQLSNSSDNVWKDKKFNSNINRKNINEGSWDNMKGGNVSSEIISNTASISVDKNITLSFNDNLMENFCPSCKMLFDKCKKRKIIDSCGHIRCCSCMYRDERCPICNENSTGDYESGIGGSSSTIVSPLGSPKPQIKIGKLPAESTSTPIKMFEKNRLPDTAQNRLKFFNSTSVKKSFGKGHRRTLSNENTKEIPTRTGRNLHELSVCSDTITTRRRKSAFNNFTNFSLENKSNPLSLVSAGQLSSMVFGKIKSLWNAQSCSINAGLNQLAGNKIYVDDMQGKITILKDSTESKTDVQCRDRDIFENEALQTVSFESELSDMFTQHTIDNNQKSAVNCNNMSTQKFTNTLDVEMKTCDYYIDCTTQNLENQNGNTRNQLNLKPLFFEVPHLEPDLMFIGRQWIFREISNILTVTETLGVLINGKSGTGKTALILQLVEYSCFGRKKGYSLPENDGIYCQINIGHDRIKALASYVVAYHFCQADNNLTCHVADFIHSIAAQLCQAPQLSAYKEYLEGKEDLRKLLEIEECCSNPEYAMRTAVLEPLAQLKILGKISSKCCVILIDALCEAEYHRPDYGYTISSFLSKMSNFFPSWLKIISTVRTNMKEHIKGLPYAYLTLDLIATNDYIEKDILDYITFRINHSSNIQKNVGLNKDNLTAHYKLINHILTISSGSFLFCKLLMDLIEKGHLVIKSSSYKILPGILSEIFLLQCNLRFQTNIAFQKVTSILNVCLSSLYPLTLQDIYFSISALSNEAYIEYNEFLEIFKLLNGFLIRRLDNTYMFFHPSFREWLLRRDYNESTKFLCDVRKGHAALAFRLSRMESHLYPDKTLELCHHILKANIFRNSQSQSVQDIQTYWVTSVSESISSALCVLKNIYSPNIKVSRFLLLAGASPDVCTEYVGHATILCMAAHEGIILLVSLLLEFGANINKTNRQGYTPLILAAIRGHCDVIRLLVAAGSDISQKDVTQQCALVHAARNGQINVVKYLLACQCSLYINSLNQVDFEEDLLQALVAAAANDYIKIVEYILDIDRVDINGIDRITGETALTIAAKNGCIECIGILLARGADVDAKNIEEQSAILLAVKEGFLSVTEKILQNNTNVEQTEKFSKKTPFIIAAEEGHLCILHMLVKNSAEREAEDIEGLTALSWACLRCHYEIVNTLIKLGCRTNHEDKDGRSLLDLAAYHGTPNLIIMLLEYGLKIEHVDKNGIRPLDRAIACRNRNVVQILLRKGGKLGPTTWAMATGKHDIFIILINKLLEDGNIFYKKQKYHDATHRYEYALRKLSLNVIAIEKSSVFVQLKVNLLLNLSRSKRKTYDLAEAIDIATQAIELKPFNYEGYYARAKAKLEKKYFNEAYADAKNAIEKSNSETLEVKAILQQFYEDIYSKILLKNGLNSCYEVSEL